MSEFLVHVGNTHTVFARLEQGRILERRSVGSAALVTVLADGFWQDWLQTGQRFFIGGVVPDLLDWLEANAAQWCVGKPQRLDVEDAQGLLEIHYQSLGFDRVCALLGAQARWPGQTAVVVDVGTAITVDVLLHGRVFEGGLIMPGTQACLDALRQSTALLPAVAADMPLPAGMLGGNTRDGMRLGVQQVVLGGIRQALDDLRVRYPDAIVLLTGGGATMLLPALQEAFSVQYVDDLVLEGMARLVEAKGRP